MTGRDRLEGFEEDASVGRPERRTARAWIEDGILNGYVILPSLAAKAIDSASLASSFRNPSGSNVTPC